MNEEYRRTAYPRLALAAVGLAAALSIAGCAGQAATLGDPAPSSAATTAGADASPTASPSPSNAAPSPSPVKPSPTAVKPTASPGYSKALIQWKDGATAISAQQGAYWLAAASDLQAGKATDSRDTSTYQNAIDELKELTSLPDAQQTPAQNAAYHKDIDGLNSFFGTPGLYS
jgi:hypothetical protein